MTSLQLAHYANLFLYVAMVALTVAMLAFAVHVAFAPRPARIPDPALVTVGGAAEEDVSDVSSSASDVSSSAEAAEDQGQRLLESRSDRWGRLGMTLSWLTTMLLVGSVICRGLAVHRVPVANMFEFTVVVTLLAMALYVGAALRRPLRWLGLFVTVPALLALGLALTVWYSPAAELLPSLQSLWLAIHVPIATLSVAIFTIAFSVLLLQLARERREQRLAAGESARSFLDALPTAQTLDRFAYSMHVVAFPLWTFSLIAGAIWAQQAWGSYWNWDPKEVWTFIIWVIYAAYLHARATSGWSRRTGNILAIVGYVAIIVNFTVVNLYAGGQHTYSGL
ncbi:Cytochrome c biogenesis protein CcsA [Austwickia sp. TVS 96-490-7B]|uniref:c-type cytochrome biogenesis protein CcsB n=1 Tax=Austwickia sp. TVS 96-490-7B TaxID=2830843 RepID=UPI001C59485B|nr:c-type cytochrome biogenesis protein CcsB [Austwickia sp. TVS 96-490-7B]MBW3084772.1 Cytochrome c biogenesis protein CcsA [Austwickia sp. TVS 96-490-7B]